MCTALHTHTTAGGPGAPCGLPGGRGAPHSPREGRKRDVAGATSRARCRRGRTKSKALTVGARDARAQGTSGSWPSTASSCTRCCSCPASSRRVWGTPSALMQGLGGACGPPAVLPLGAHTAAHAARSPEQPLCSQRAQRAPRSRGRAGDRLLLLLAARHPQRALRPRGELAASSLAAAAVPPSPPGLPDRCPVPLPAARACARSRGNAWTCTSQRPTARVRASSPQRLSPDPAQRGACQAFCVCAGAPGGLTRSEEPPHTCWCVRVRACVCAHAQTGSTPWSSSSRAARGPSGTRCGAPLPLRPSVN